MILVVLFILICLSAFLIPEMNGALPQDPECELLLINLTVRLIFFNSALRTAGVDIPPPALVGGGSLRTLEIEVKNRQMQFWAVQLGVDFASSERASTIENRIFDMLPGILDQKGIGIGKIIQKNFSAQPTEPQEVLGVLEDNSDTIRLRDLSGQFGEYNIYAISFALNATPYSPDSESIED